MRLLSLLLLLLLLQVLVCADVLGKGFPVFCIECGLHRSSARAGARDDVDVAERRREVALRYIEPPHPLRHLHALATLATTQMAAPAAQAGACGVQSRCR